MYLSMEAKDKKAVDAGGMTKGKAVLVDF